MIKTNPTCGCGEESACNEVELQCDPCCRCVPQRLCATFEAYGCGCDGVTAMLLLTGDSAYTGTLVCGESSLELRVLLERDVYNKCYWRVLAEQAYLDERFEIGSGQQSCEGRDRGRDSLFFPRSTGSPSGFTRRAVATFSTLI